MKETLTLKGKNKSKSFAKIMGKRIVRGKYLRLLVGGKTSLFFFGEKGGGNSYEPMYRPPQGTIKWCPDVSYSPHLVLVTVRPILSVPVTIQLLSVLYRQEKRPMENHVGA